MTLRTVHLPIAGSAAASLVDTPLRIATEPFLSADVPPSAVEEATGELRTSSYTIYVDLPNDGEHLLLVHAYSGAYDRVSRRVATYLRSRELATPAKPLYGAWSPEPPVEGAPVEPAAETLERLKRRGYLTTLSALEEERYFATIAARLHHVASRQRPGYILIPTYQCNLRCGYCFQDHMRTDPAHRHLLRVMEASMVDRIFRGLDRIDAAHGAPAGAPRNIILFGGEPLLAESRPIIEYLIHKAEGRARFSAVTNATDLDAYAALLGEGGIASIQVTLDGPPAEHDRRRVYADGSGSFQRIVRNIALALERGVQVSVRMNVDRANVDSLPALADELVRQGFTDHPRFSSYVAAVHASTDNVDARDVFDSWQLTRALERLQSEHPSMAHLHGPDDDLLESARSIFEDRSDPLPRLRTSFCGAHTTMYVIDSFADIYACWERTGDPSLRIGAIAEDGEVLISAAMTRAWRSRNVTSNETCRKCRYATYCGGGCAALAEEHQGSMFASFCDGFGKRFRATVARAYGEHIAGERRERRAARICDL